MKKAISLLICAALCVCIFSGCSKIGDASKDVKLKPTEPVNAEDLIPENEFIGTYKNKDYTATVEKNEDGVFTVSIKSAVKDNKNAEWTLSGYFSSETYRINYTDAVKTVITYDRNGKETERKNEYENGMGRIQFTSDGDLIWNNSLDSFKTQLKKQ